MVVNESQAEAWNGYEGQHWADHYERYDAVNGAFNPFILDAARIGKRDRVLDVGCGNGQLTRLAAGRGRLAMGIDLSAPMLARARERATAEGVANVSFEQGDAQIHPFPDGAFDVAISRAGVMFFADPVAAFANLHRALDASGRLAFMCMTSLEGTDLGTVFAALAEYLPAGWPLPGGVGGRPPQRTGPVPGAERQRSGRSRAGRPLPGGVGGRPPQRTGADGSGPTSFADPARIQEVLGAAGFRDMTCTRVEGDQHWGVDAADAAAFLGAWGPVKYHLGLVEPGAAAEAREALERVMEDFQRPEGVVTVGTGWLVEAAG